MKNDLISRQTAIDAVVGCTNCGTEDVLRAYVTKHSLENGWTGGIVDALDAIEQLSSAQPEQRWIPVTERLPEEGEVVLTQAKFKDDVKMAVSSRIDYNYWTTWGTRDINIIAWMPLPEPYQERNEDA